MIFGNVIISGKPNVGKSTLINAIFNKKVSIVSRKPQTTRNQINKLFVTDKYSIMFYDTPGYHTPKNKLDLFLNYEVRKSLKIQDVTLFLFDPTRERDNEDDVLLSELKKYKISKIILVVTKIDLVNFTDEIKQKIEMLAIEINAFKTIYISSLNDKDIQKLLTLIVENLDDIEELDVHQLNNMENDNDKILISDTIREVIINNFRDEIPYSVGVKIESFNYEIEKKLFKIFAFIIVEKESQKPILIGKKGLMIKKIGMLSRAELETIYDSKIFLSLNVKVKENWRDSNSYLKEMGYIK
ncbi:MAG: GTPase Era [Malacoplasma sp.]